MSDPILDSFLERQQREGTSLAESSDVLELHPIGPPPARRYLARFHARCLVRRGGRVTAVERFDVGIRFPDSYLRRIAVPEVLTWLAPIDVWHPNVLFPMICPGRLLPSTGLVEIIHQCFEIGVGQKLTRNERDCLNPDACAFARAHPDRFPADSRPLGRATFARSFAVEADAWSAP
jgi:hypothetical protein